MQAASLRRSLENRHIFFLNCQTSSYKLNAPDQITQWTLPIKYQFLGHLVPESRHHYSKQHIHLFLSFITLAFLLRKPWEKILIVLPSINSSTEKEQKIILLDQKKKVNLYSVSKYLSPQFGILIFNKKVSDKTRRTIIVPASQVCGPYVHAGPCTECNACSVLPPRNS